MSYVFSSKRHSHTHSAASPRSGGHSMDGREYSADFEEQTSPRSGRSGHRSEPEMTSEVEEDIVEDLDDVY